MDADGDHFPNELVNLLRAANHITQSRGIEKLLVLGRRISRHRPMGYLRGELEELADRILLDALAYDATLQSSRCASNTPLAWRSFRTSTPATRSSAEASWGMCSWRSRFSAECRIMPTTNMVSRP